MAGGLTCNSCNSEFSDEYEQKLHYKSEWHRYNLKRKVAGVPGVTEALFLARQSALAAEQSKLSEDRMLYECALCGKEYRSSKAHAQHLKSRSHIVRASQGPESQSIGITVIKPLGNRGANKPTSTRKPLIPRELESEESEDSGDEWVEVDPDDELVGEAIESLMDLDVSEPTSSSAVEPDDDADDEELDPSCCFICDLKHKTIESCMVHMHKQHGFFIPDVEYLKDPEGLLTYVGLKVKRDFMCLYCNDRCQPFLSLEAVRKHMIAKGHCKVRYGDGGDDEEAELEEFYDYSSSYVDSDGKQLVVSDEIINAVELGTGGSELVITRKTDNGISVKALGSREFLRYYRQKPRPSLERDIALAISLASRYQSMGLATVQSKEQIVRMKVLKEMKRSGVEMMRSKIGMKSNVIRNLPKNVPY
ncbi:cytoplasmic 60S subunit biogenesis factor REI1 homolog 1-like [Magnolia sinica]|uniref:cytoplasmic 60S subunit biogenesis factor REI1 homolog 1-like n=1 Tax=Magnolia sinica TaxID=86752 RepID=UPI00265AA9C9|nr:cytoplasmic 60S subunit biogenesis factor REI1 homolog 1-like [Magnolia sinica]